ncbi:hypothetical protein GALMADRAFT_1060155 [Galerina marginata CBS 339.88]|uniref:Uncharacterized protein n=1 Tax=Galerina marginata (strain CBS 339.88) TaxID=685588 RepID=A0A067SMN9_GALM3|nr:hypothetical protein GALMADRAFT_1060155 [Galerina marginata CBS 339.88]
MVVNRKQPSIPVPPAPISRSSSTQPVPTKRTKNAPKPTPLHNDREIDSRKPAKPPVKPTKHKTKKRRSLIDRLFLVSLSLFAFYTFYTCRPNPLFTSPPSDPSNPLCLSLSAYSTHILEPYILPPLKHSLSTAHALAEPYIAQSKTHLAPYVAPVVRTSRTLQPYITRALSTSKRLWTNTLLPYWRTAVVPRYQKHLRPRLVPLANTAYKYYRFYVLNPLHIQATRAQAGLHNLYTTYLGPYVAKVQPHVQQAWNSLHTVSSRAYETYHAHVHPRLVDGWVAARPVLCEVWKHGKAFTLRASEVGATQLKKAGKEAVTLRRTYVDPQVRKIWDKVAESTPGPVSGTPTSEKKTVSSTTANKPAATTINADSPDPTPEEAPEDELASSTGAPTSAHPSTDTPTSSPEDQDEKHPRSRRERARTYGADRCAHRRPLGCTPRNAHPN